MVDILPLISMVVFASGFSILVQNTEKAGIFDPVTTAVSSWIAEFGYPAVFFVALLENLFPPIPSEVIFPLVGFVAFHNNLGISHAIAMGLTGALGSTVGAIVIYFLALRVGKPALLGIGRYVGVGENGLLKAESWFQKYGVIAVFSGRMAPAVRELISVPAGIGRMDIKKFILFTFAGSAIWSVALTLLGYFLGDAWNEMTGQLSYALSIIAILILVTVVIVLGLRYYKKRKSSYKRKDPNNIHEDSR
jgi:membrane protein DedA with SNARE-associated domain